MKTDLWANSSKVWKPIKKSEQFFLSQKCSLYFTIYYRLTSGKIRAQSFVILERVRFTTQRVKKYMIALDHRQIFASPETD